MLVDQHKLYMSPSDASPVTASPSPPRCCIGQPDDERAPRKDLDWVVKRGLPEREAAHLQLRLVGGVRGELPDVTTQPGAHLVRGCSRTLLACGTALTGCRRTSARPLASLLHAHAQLPLAVISSCIPALAREMRCAAKQALLAACRRQRGDRCDATQCTHTKASESSTSASRSLQLCVGSDCRNMMMPCRKRQRQSRGQAEHPNLSARAHPGRHRLADSARPRLT